MPSPLLRRRGAVGRDGARERAGPGRGVDTREVDPGADVAAGTRADGCWPHVALADTGGPFALDPARQRCAYIDRAHARRVLDLAIGTTRTLPGELARAEVCGWLAEPDAIVVRSTTTPIVLDRIDPATGARTRHLVVQPPAMGLKAVDSFVLHAGGTRYAYSYGQELSQLFLMNATS